MVENVIKIESGTVGTLICQNVAHVAAPADMFRITGTKGELQITSGRDGQLVIYNDKNPRGRVVMNAVTGKIPTERRLRIFVKLCLTEKPWRRHRNSRRIALPWLCISPSNRADGKVW